MARPQRNNVDYFPFYCEDGEKMFYLEETYGNDGFATFIKLLRELAKTDYHFLNLSKPSTKMFLSAKCKISKEILESIINDLVELGKFDKTLWKENSIVWCQDFIDSIQDAYLRRNNNCITYEGLLQHLISLGIRKQVKCKPKVDVNTQTKLKDSKEDETKKELPIVYRKFDHLSITIDEINKILELGYKMVQLTEIMDSIENYSKNKSYKSLYLTSLNWIRKKHPEVEEKDNQPEYDSKGKIKIDFGTQTTKY